MGFSCFYGAEKVLKRPNFNSVIWVGTRNYRNL